MNSKERLSKAMQHRAPDRIAVMCQLALGHYFLYCHDKPADIWFDTEAFTRALVELQRRDRFDGILVNLPGRPPDWERNIKEYETVQGCEYLRWTSGFETIVPSDDNPQTFLPGKSPLERAKYKSVDVQDPGTYRLSAGLGGRSSSRGLSSQQSPLRSLRPSL